MKKCNFGKLAETCDTHVRGSSSFNMHDHAAFFDALNLQIGNVVLDLGCGPGDYSLACARIVGDSGRVISLDKQPELLDDLKNRANALGLKNIQTMACDITRPLPLDSHSVDVCMIITVLHHPAVSPHRTKLFAEIHRVLKEGGRLVTVDVKKDDASFGPPLHMRLSPEELEESLREPRFRKIKHEDLGYNVMLQFEAL